MWCPARLHIKAKKCAVHLSDEPMRCPFPMNCLCSTCGLTLIPGGWWETLSLSDCGRVARQSGLVFFKIEFNGLEFGIRTESGHKCSIRSACATVFPLQRNSFVA